MINQSLHRKSRTIGFENARRNRKAFTEAEGILWEALRGRKFLNSKFRRQHPIASYIADFYCHELNLIIEVDGNYHLKEEQANKDAQRTKELEGMGVKLHRLTNNEVHCIDFVLNRIKSFIDSSKVPSPKGEG